MHNTTPLTQVLHAPASSTLASSQSILALTLRRVTRRHEKRVSTRSWSSLGASRAWHSRPHSMATASSGSPPISVPASGSAPGDKKAEKSSWASAVDSINPWAGSRSSTPAPKEPAPPQPPMPVVTGGDHSINLIYGLSARKYPSDCPPLKVKWFHAIDVGHFLGHAVSRR